MPLYKSADDHSQSHPFEDEVIFFDEKPSQNDVVEMEKPVVIEFSLPPIPGSELLEVEEGPQSHELSVPKEQKMEIRDPWDWQSGGMSGLVEWVKNRFNSIPRHSGRETTGIERAISYLKKVNSEISRALSSDYDGEIDVASIEKARKEIYSAIDRLEDAHEKLLDSQYKRKKADKNDEIIKEAKAPYTGGVLVTVPLLISRCARVCINGTISAGHDITDLYNEQVKKYSLNLREQAELVQLLEDMNFPLRSDRLYMPDEVVDTRNGRGDLASNYHA